MSSKVDGVGAMMRKVFLHSPSISQSRFDTPYQMKIQMIYHDLKEPKSPESQFLKVLMDRKASWSSVLLFYILWTWAVQRQQLKALNLRDLDKRDVLITIYIAWVFGRHPFQACADLFR